MIHSKDFFDLQMTFAEKVASLSGTSLEQSLLDYTNLYVRFGLGRDFDCRHPVWLEYLSGLANPVDLREWTYRFFLTRPRDIQPPSVAATFGCFSYAKLSDEHIRLHFHNAEATGRSPLSIECFDARLAELRSLFQHVERTRQAARKVAGVSWLYNLTAYRRLFPPSYPATARVAAPRFRNMPLWGQFLDRHGAVRESMAVPFLQRLSHQTDVNGMARCFPLQAMAVEAPVSDFHAFYEKHGDARTSVSGKILPGGIDR